MRRLASFIALLTSVVASGGCSDGEPATPARICVDAGIDPSCVPAYEPTYDAIYANTFKPSCAKSGGSCHGGAGRQAGIDFDDAEAAFTALRARAIRPGEPECSTLAQVIVSTDGMVRMPPGKSLPAGERCAIVKWIASGAPR